MLKLTSDIVYELERSQRSYTWRTFVLSRLLLHVPIVVSSLPFSLLNKEGCDDITLLVERITSLHVHVLNLACYCLKSWSWVPVNQLSLGTRSPHFLSLSLLVSYFVMNFIRRIFSVCHSFRSMCQPAE